MPPDPLGSRRESRERVLSLLYEADLKGEPPSLVLAALPVPPDDFTVGLITGVGDHLDELDDVIRRFSRGWSLERMPVIDRALQLDPALGRGERKLYVVSSGSSLLKVALHPAAGWLRFAEFIRFATTA